MFVELFIEIDGEDGFGFQFGLVLFRERAGRTNEEKENNQRKDEQGKKGSEKDLEEASHAFKNFNRQK